MWKEDNTNKSKSSQRKLKGGGKENIKRNDENKNKILENGVEGGEGKDDR
jgi:hypothetical protein